MANEKSPGGGTDFGFNLGIPIPGQGRAKIPHWEGIGWVNTLLGVWLRGGFLETFKKNIALVAPKQMSTPRNKMSPPLQKGGVFPGGGFSGGSLIGFAGCGICHFWPKIPQKSRRKFAGFGIDQLKTWKCGIFKKFAKNCPAGLRDWTLFCAGLRDSGTL